jgi:hypothetical protein
MVNWQCFSMCPQNWGLHPNGNFSEENYHEPSDLGFSNKLSSLQAESPWTGKNFDCGSHGPFPRFTYRKWWCSRSMLVYPRVNRHLCWFNPPKTHALQPGPPDVAGPRSGCWGHRHPLPGENPMRHVWWHRRLFSRYCILCVLFLIYSVCYTY